MISKEQLEEERFKPDVLRSCYNCASLTAALRWWCGNDEASKARGTKIPGCIHCPFWSPNKEAQKTMDYNKQIQDFMIAG